MMNRETGSMMRASALVVLLLGLVACSKKEPVETDAATAAEARPAVVESAPVDCHPQLQKLMDALPSRPEIDGQKESDRKCKSGMVSVTYGIADPVEIRFELTALKYEESDLERLGQKDGQSILDGLRKTMEAKIVVLEAQITGANATAGDPQVDVMKPEERTRIPRQVSLPDGVKAMVSSTDGNSWELASVMSDRHMLVISWIDNRKESNTDEAVAKLTKLAAEVHYEKLK